MKDLSEYDHLIGERKEDNIGVFQIINGKKIYQAIEETEADREFNRKCNAYRASRCSTPFEFLNKITNENHKS